MEIEKLREVMKEEIKRKMDMKRVGFETRKGDDSLSQKLNNIDKS